MSLVANHTRRAVYQTPGPLLEVDVARHLWSSSRVRRINGANTDPEHAFKLGLTSSKTAVLKLTGDALPNKVNYRLLDDGYSIVLIPVLFNNTFNVPLRSIKINLPDQIRSECFAINQFKTDDGEHALIIDCITETGVLITIIVKVLDFIVNGGSTMTSESYQEWAKITQPYGFDIRLPHILYSYRHDYLVVLLRDGGIIGLQRNSRFESEPIIFNDNSYLESLGQLFRPWANKTTFNGERDLSLKTVIDAIRFDDYLLTVTINRHLKIWSISKQSLILEKDLAEFVSMSTPNNREYLDSTPTKLLDIFTTATIDGIATHYLTIYLPFGNGAFKIFTLQQDDFDIIPLGQNQEFPVSLPDSNSIWLVGDFQLVQNSNGLDLWVLWKSNTSSFIQMCQLGTDFNPQWFAIHDSTTVVEKTIGESWSEFYTRKIFQSGIYSKQIIETALPIFESHFLSGQLNNDDIVALDGLSLFDRVTKSVSKGIQLGPNYDSTLQTQFSRFDTLCLEFKKQADEPLKFFLDEQSGLLLVINRQEYSYVRPSSSLELLDHNKTLKIDTVGNLRNIGDHLQFLNIISEFKNSLSSDVFAQVKSETLRVFTNPERDTDALLGSIYENQLKDKFNPINLGKLVEELSQFPKLFVLIDDLLKYQSVNQEFQPFSSSKQTPLGTAIFTEVTKESVEVNSDILFSLLILLLVLNFDDKNLLDSVSKRVVKLIVSYEVFKESLQIGFNATTGNLELDEPYLPSQSLFTKALEAKFTEGLVITKETVVEFATQQIIPFIQTNEFLYYISTYLIKSGLSNLVYERFLKFFDETAVFHLLKSLVFFKTNQANKASKYLSRYADDVSKYTLTPTEKQIFKPLDEFSVFFGCNLGKYYLNVAILFLNNLQFDQAEKFMVLLGDKRMNEGFEKKYLDDEAYTYFTISAEKLDLVNANRTLQWIRSEKLRKEALNKLLYVMYKHQSIHKLGELSALKEDPMVDALILKRAKTDDVKRSLWFYQVLYAHRLNCGDFRGACEALYEFVVQNRATTDAGLKNTILELYSVILNVVGTLTADDQWIIKHGDEEDVVSITELYEEKALFSSGSLRPLKYN